MTTRYDEATQEFVTIQRVPLVNAPQDLLLSLIRGEIPRIAGIPPTPAPENELFAVAARLAAERGCGVKAKELVERLSLKMPPNITTDIGFHRHIGGIFRAAGWRKDHVSQWSPPTTDQTRLPWPKEQSR
ncbi:MAG: hypothetical protein WC985_06175 [Thermoplasmata archaeon]